MTDEQRASLNPEDMMEGGGLYDDVDAVIKKARFAMWDYDGKSPVAVPAFQLTMEVDGIEGDQIEHWSAGNSKNWVPSKDGKYLLKVGTDDQIRKSTNAFYLLQSLINAERAFAEKLAGGDASVIDGTKVHLKREPAPERKGLEKKESKYEKTILLVSEVLSMPGEDGGKKGGAKKSTGKKGGGKTTTTDAAADTDLQTMAQEFVINTLAEQGEVAVKALAALALKEFKDKGVDYMGIVKIVASPDFQNNTENGWACENGMIKLG